MPLAINEQQRSAGEVLDDHLKRRAAEDLEGDLMHNYAPDVVLLCEHGPRHGREAIRQSAEALAKQVPDASFDYPLKAVAGEYAFLLWRAVSAKATADNGADSFVIRDGRIVMQSVVYELRPKS
jgi:ketosteroid isomerase-like protein